MAISVTNKTSGTASSATNPTTASITPSADALILICLNLYIAGGSITAPSSITGNGITYALVNNSSDQDSSADENKQYLYRGMSSSPSAGIITINGYWDYIGWTIDEVTGCASGSNGANAVVQSATNFSTGGATSGTVTLGAFASASNGAYGMVNSASQPASAGSGWTQIINGSNIGYHQTQWRADNDTTCDWTFSSTNYGAVAIEIAIAATGGDRLVGGNLVGGNLVVGALAA